MRLFTIAIALLYLLFIVGFVSSQQSKPLSSEPDQTTNIDAMMRNMTEKHWPWPQKPPYTIRFVASLGNFTNQTTAHEIYSGYQFWQYMVNNISKGIDIGNGKRLMVDIRYGIDNGNATAHELFLQTAVTRGQADFILGGDTDRAINDKNVAQMTSRITMLCCHGPPIIYRDAAKSAESLNIPNTLFGIHIDSQSYTPKLIKHIIVNERAQRIALVQLINETMPNATLFTVTTCEEAKRQLYSEMKAMEKLRSDNSSSMHTLNVTYDIYNISMANAADPAYFNELALKLKGDYQGYVGNGIQGYDTLIACTKNSDGKMLLQALHDNSVAFKTLFSTVAPTDPSTVQYLANQGVLMQFVLSAGQWHPRLDFRAPPNSNAFWQTAADYAEQFYIYSGNRSATYTIASSSAAAFAIQIAIEKAFIQCNNIDQWNGNIEELLYTNSWTCQEPDGLPPKTLTGNERILEMLRNIDEDSFFGRIHFDSATQRNDGRDTAVFQLLKNSNNLNVSSIYNATNFGYDNDTTPLIQEVVLPTEYETKAIVLPRDPRPNDPDWCPDGHGLGIDNTCVECEPGTHRFNLAGDENYLKRIDIGFQCLPCNRTGYAPYVGQTSCYNCPNNTATQREGAQNRNECLCNVGFYSRETGGQCFECENGLECANGAFTIQTGYWVYDGSDVNEPVTVFQCTPAIACQETTDVCSSGWGGNLCSLCGYNNYKETNYDDKYFLFFGTCTACTHPSVNVLIFLIVFVLWTVVNIFVAEEVPSIALFIDWMQLMSLVGSLNCGWPQSLQIFFAVSQLFAFEVTVVSLKCVFDGWNFENDMVLQFIIPWVIVLLRLMRWLYSERIRRKEHTAHEEVENKRINSAANRDKDHSSSSTIKKQTRKLLGRDWSRLGKFVLNTLEITYLASTQMAFSALRGITIGDSTVVFNAPATPQTGTIVAIGAVGLAIYSIAFPVLVMLILYSWSPTCIWRRKQQLTLHRSNTVASKSTMSTTSASSKSSVNEKERAEDEDPGGFYDKKNKRLLGWLYKDFRLEVYYMSGSHMFHRFLFAGIVSLIVSPALQLLLSFVLTSAFAIWFAASHPYFNHRLNLLQGILYLSVLFQIGLGTCYFSGIQFNEGWRASFQYVSFFLIALAGVSLIWIIVMDTMEYLAYTLTLQHLTEKLVAWREHALETKLSDWEKKHTKKQVKELAKIFNPAVLRSWLKNHMDPPPPPLWKKVYTQMRKWCSCFGERKKENSTARESEPVKLTEEEVLFFTVNKQMLPFLKKRKVVSSLSMMKETQLLRRFTLDYPEIISYLFHEDEKSIRYLYRFINRFYKDYWNNQESYIRSMLEHAHILACFEGLLTWIYRGRMCCAPCRSSSVDDDDDPGSPHGIILSSSNKKIYNEALLCFPDQRKRENDGNDDSGIVHTPTSPVDDDERLENVTWIINRQERAKVAAWLLWSREKRHLEARKSFQTLSFSIYNMKDGGRKKACWEERVMHWFSIWSLPWTLKAEKKDRDTFEDRGLFHDDDDSVERDALNVNVRKTVEWGSQNRRRFDSAKEEHRTSSTRSNYRRGDDVV